ncbi:MAG: RDD family protein, partial [Myxococcota bacterium]
VVVSPPAARAAPSVPAGWDPLPAPRVTATPPALSPVAAPAPRPAPASNTQPTEEISVLSTVQAQARATSTAPLDERTAPLPAPPSQRAIETEEITAPERPAAPPPNPFASDDMTVPESALPAAPPPPAPVVAAPVTSSPTPDPDATAEEPLPPAAVPEVDLALMREAAAAAPALVPPLPAPDENRGALVVRAASWTQKLAAALVDGAVAVALSLGYGVVQALELPEGEAPDEGAVALSGIDWLIDVVARHAELLAGMTVALALAVAAYEALAVALLGRTAGQALMGLRLVHLGGGKLGLLRAFARGGLAGAGLLLLGAGWLWAPFDHRRAALHDKWTGLVLVEVPPPPPVTEAPAEPVAAEPTPSVPEMSSSSSESAAPPG